MFLFNNYQTAEISFLPSFSATLYVYLADSYDKTLRQFMSEDNSAGVLVNPKPQPTEISIAGITTVLEYNAIDTLGEPVKFVGFVHDKYIYVFGSDDVDSKNRQLFYDHMLNSIKFVEVTESGNYDDKLNVGDFKSENTDDSDEKDDHENNEDNNNN